MGSNTSVTDYYTPSKRRLQTKKANNKNAKSRKRPASMTLATIDLTLDSDEEESENERGNVASSQSTRMTRSKKVLSTIKSPGNLSQTKEVSCQNLGEPPSKKTNNALKNCSFGGIRLKNIESLVEDNATILTCETAQITDKNATNNDSQTKSKQRGRKNAKNKKETMSKQLQNEVRQKKFDFPTQKLKINKSITNSQIELQINTNDDSLVIKSQEISKNLNKNKEISNSLNKNKETSNNLNKNKETSNNLNKNKEISNNLHKKNETITKSQIIIENNAQSTSTEIKDFCLEKDDFKANLLSTQYFIDENQLEKIKRLLKNCKEQLEISCRDTTVDLSETTTVNPLSNETNLKFLYDILQHIFNQKNLYKLLTFEELNLIESFLKFEQDYRIFCLRLFKRIDKWHRLFKFCSQIKLDLSTNQIMQMYIELKQNNIISTDISEEDLQVLLDMLLIPEFKLIYKNFKFKSIPKNKEDLVKNLMDFCKKQRSIIPGKSMEIVVKKLVVENLGKCVKINEKFKNVLNKVHLMFSFTSPEYIEIQELYRVLHDIKAGRIYFPEYTCNMVDVFQSSANFDRFSMANQLYLERENAKSPLEKLETTRKIFEEFQQVKCENDVSLPHHLRKFNYANKLASALTNSCKDLTTLTPEEVTNWLENLINKDGILPHKRGFWHQQLALVYDHHLKNKEKSLQAIERGLRDPHISKVSLTDLMKRYRTLDPLKSSNDNDEDLNHKFPTKVIDASIKCENKKGKRMYIKRINGEEEYYTVEDLAMNHYTENYRYTKGIHAEGSFLKNLFFYLFWDVIFDSTIEGAFLSKLQSLPIDFNSKEFYENRKEKITERLEEIAKKWTQKQLEDFLKTKIALYSSYSTIILTKLNRHDYCNILNCIGREKLSKIMMKFAKDFRLYRSGMPDLFLWTPHEETCCFVEVKGEKDVLSTKQKMWLKFLLSLDVKAEVCYVHTIGSRAFEKYNHAHKEESQF